MMTLPQMAQTRHRSNRGRRTTQTTATTRQSKSRTTRQQPATTTKNKKGKANYTTSEIRGLQNQRQQIEKVNPLLPYYLKLQAELRLQFEAIGLNYRTTPSKINEPTNKGVDESDPMMEYYRNMKK